MTGRFDLRLGDSRNVLKVLASNSIDSCVSDPPYALDSIVRRFGGEDAAPAKVGTDGAFARASAGFMGQQWDVGDTAFSADFWREVYRVLKPGAYLLAFGGTRTYHRLVCAIEDAGFSIDDMVPWLYGSGMPKSHKPSVYLERILCERRVSDDGSISWHYRDDGALAAVAPPFRHPQAQAWWGMGTALKPAVEPICLAQKPMIGSIAENILAYQVGVLNIDGCRIDAGEGYYAPGDEGYEGRDRAMDGFKMGSGVAHDLGRWPANLLHDGSDGVVAAFPNVSGMKAPVGPHNASERTSGIYNPMGARDAHAPRDAGGSAARFFYGSKASKADREEGCADLDDAVLARSNLAQSMADDGDVVESAGGGFNAARIRKNNHPTVKPTDLMRYLCRLITPSGGTVLDPFMGSGSTGKAAMLEGFRFVGIERETPFYMIAQARVRHAARRREISPPQADLFAAE